MEIYSFSGNALQLPNLIKVIMIIFNLNCDINASRGSHTVCTTQRTHGGHMCCLRITQSCRQSHSRSQSLLVCLPRPVSARLPIGVFVIQFEFNVTLKASFTVICK